MKLCLGPCFYTSVNILWVIWKFGTTSLPPMRTLHFHNYRIKIIEEKAEFEKSWHSFVDVQAIRRFREGVKYVTKYLTKTRNES